MKLESLKSEANLHTDPSNHDIDVVDKLGPTIYTHLNALNTLCKLIPTDSADIIAKLSELKTLVGSKIKLQANVLEKNIVTDITLEDINKMYAEYEPMIGEASWVVISKKLKESGMPKESADQLINEAILSQD